MKSQSRSLASMILLSPALTAAFSTTLHAQGTWQVDQKHSVAHLSLGSELNVLEIGSARVSGDVVFEPNDPADPSVSLEIDADDDTAAGYSAMSFALERSWMTRDGKGMIAGQLSATLVERSVTAEPNESYAGPQYGDPVAHTYTNQITLISSGPEKLADDDAVMELNGTASIYKVDFPQLVDALTLDPWPNMLENGVECEGPSTIGEDYNGGECTGTVIARDRNEVVPTEGPSGEGFYGFEPVVMPDRNRAMIELDLKLQRISASPVATR